jgi:acetyl esterase/lipase
MAINKYMRAALKALSYAEPDLKANLQANRWLRNLANPPTGTHRVYEVWDYHIESEKHQIPVRIFEPKKRGSEEIILYFHGGGWVLGNINAYTRTCAMLADETGRRVFSVDYLKAPEHPFPAGLLDCYEAAKEVEEYQRNRKTGLVLMGDSAGANLAAAVSLMARDRGEFSIPKQILLYPATYYDHGPDSPFPSVKEKGEGYLLTSRRICDYIDLYIQHGEDRISPYFAPLLAKDFSHQPDTLLITAEHDPLRDEGEAYGEKLKQGGNRVVLYRMDNALHGYFNLPIRFVHVERTLRLVREFLDEKGKKID